ncbi:MAG: serpin family protein [Planctomycetes bacterium]|nr:serpin family protein [Planctomycetota bacterium]
MPAIHAWKTFGLLLAALALSACEQSSETRVSSVEKASPKPTPDVAPKPAPDLPPKPVDAAPPPPAGKATPKTAEEAPKGAAGDAVGKPTGDAAPAAATTLPAPKPEWEADEKALIAGNTRFALNLFRAAAGKPDQNAFLSPLSVTTALGMVAAGARGDTLAEMQAALGFPTSGDAAHRALHHLQYQLQKNAGPAYDLTIANRLWPAKGFDVLPTFLKVTAEHYGADAEVIDVAAPDRAADAVNGWCKERTRGLIPRIIEASDVSPDLRLCLTNAVYFKGKWKDEFSKKATRVERFRLPGGKTIDARLMRRSGRYAYQEAECVQVISLPYKGDAISMVILLPRAIDGLAALEGSLTPERLAAFVSGLGSREVNVTMPSFKMDWSGDLVQVLSSLGMRRAFDGGKADLGGIAPVSPDRNLFVGFVKHGAFVKVDEEGAEAAAVTAVGVDGSSAPPPPVEFRADHPFLFLLRDNRTGCLLFIGRVVEPAAP